MDIQEIIAFVILAQWPISSENTFKKKKAAGDCGTDDCGCH
jgi:hypothetical protein